MHNISSMKESRSSKPSLKYKLVHKAIGRYNSVVIVDQEQNLMVNNICRHLYASFKVGVEIFRKIY